MLQLFVYTFKDASTVDSGSRYICRPISLTSEFRVPPQHSTSCILGIPLKARELIPGTRPKRLTETHPTVTYCKCKRPSYLTTPKHSQSQQSDFFFNTIFTIQLPKDWYETSMSRSLANEITETVPQLSRRERQAHYDQHGKASIFPTAHDCLHGRH